MHDILKQKLSQKNWDYKYELYKNYFNFVEYKRKQNKDIKISVIVISWRMHPDTLKNFEILNNQNEIPFELIFVNNGGSDKEFSNLASFVDKYISLNKNTGAYLARNIGAVFADSPILLFLEDDGVPDDDILKSHYYVFCKFHAVSVRGVYLARTNNYLNERQTVYYWGDSHFPSFVNLEGNASYCSNVFYKVGGWDDSIFYGHGGLELSMRILKIEPNKRKQIYSPLPIIYHDFVQNESEFQRKRNIHVEAYKYLKKKHVTLEDHLKEWDNLFLREDMLIKKDTKPYFKKSFDNLKEDIYRRNNERIKYMNDLYVPSYNLTTVSEVLESSLALNEKRGCVIFGAGSLGRRLSSLLERINITPSYFVDNDSNKWGNQINGVEVIPPNKIPENCIIIVASMYSYEISPQLIKLGYEKNKDFVIMK